MARIIVECVIIKSLPVRRGLCDIMNYLAVLSAQYYVDRNQLNTEDSSPTGAIGSVSIYFGRNRIRTKSLICALLSLCTESCLADTWIWKSRPCPERNLWHKKGHMGTTDTMWAKLSTF